MHTARNVLLLTLALFSIAEGNQLNSYQNETLALVLYVLAGISMVAIIIDVIRAHTPLPSPVLGTPRLPRPNCWQRMTYWIRSNLLREQADRVGFIPMKDAADKIYTDAYINKSIWAKAAEEMSGSGVKRGSPDDILNYIATHVSGKIPIYGKKAPSSAFGKISNDDIRASFFDESATILRDRFYDKSIYWTDLAVKSEDLNGLIEDLQVQSGFVSSKS